MSLSIRPVDPWDEDEMDVVQELYVEAQRAEVPDARVFSRADSVALLRRPDGASFYHAFAAVDGDRIVGQTWVTGSTTDHLHQAWLWAWVPPRFGRRGIGTELVRFAEQHVRDLGRRTAVTQIWTGPDGRSGYRPFAERLGYRLGLIQVERRQRLPMDEEQLAALEAEAAARTSAYTLRTVVGPLPEELVQPYLDIYNLLHLEMPAGEMEVEMGRRTAVEHAAQEDEIAEAGRTRVTALALDAGGAVRAYSCAVTGAPDLPERSVDQWGTLVHPEHRGHRLGLAVKCALTRALQEHVGDREFVRTSNAEVNAPMVAINEALGFEIHSIEGEFQKALQTP